VSAEGKLSDGLVAVALDPAPYTERYEPMFSERKEQRPMQFQYAFNGNRMLAERIGDYFDRTRGIGHTRALLDACSSRMDKRRPGDPIALFLTRDEERNARDSAMEQRFGLLGSLTVNDLNRGIRAPVLLDNHVVQEMAREARCLRESMPHVVAVLPSLEDAERFREAHPRGDRLVIQLAPLDPNPEET